jgi:hypothetical protein
MVAILSVVVLAACPALAQPINGSAPVRDLKKAEAIFRARLDSARLRFTAADV